MPNLTCNFCGRSFRNLSDLEEHMARFHPEDDLIGKRTTTKSKYAALKENSRLKKRKKRGRRSRRSKKIIIVDGMNIAQYGSNSQPSYKNLYIVYKTLKSKGYKAKIVVSAAMKYKIDDPVRLHKMKQRGIVLEADAKEDDDLTIIELARSYNTKVITNDRFMDHPKANEIEKIRFTILGSTISFSPPF